MRFLIFAFLVVNVLSCGTVGFLSQGFNDNLKNGTQRSAASTYPAGVPSFGSDWHPARPCSSDFSCGFGDKCVKEEFQTQGICGREDRKLIGPASKKLDFLKNSK